MREDIEKTPWRRYRRELEELWHVAKVSHPESVSFCGSVFWPAVPVLYQAHLVVGGNREVIAMDVAPSGSTDRNRAWQWQFASNNPAYTSLRHHALRIHRPLTERFRVNGSAPTFAAAKQAAAVAAISFVSVCELLTEYDNYRSKEAVLRDQLRDTASILRRLEEGSRWRWLRGGTHYGKKGQ